MRAFNKGIAQEMTQLQAKMSTLKQKVRFFQF